MGGLKKGSLGLKIAIYWNDHQTTAQGIFLWHLVLAGNLLSLCKLEGKVLWRKESKGNCSPLIVAVVTRRTVHWDPKSCASELGPSDGYYHRSRTGHQD